MSETEAAPDQIVFVMAVGERRFQKSVPEGRAAQILREIVASDSPWIEVDDLNWIVRDHVLYAYLSRSDHVPIASV